jgi:cytochrome b561
MRHRGQTALQFSTIALAVERFSPYRREKVAVADSDKAQLVVLRKFHFGGAIVFIATIAGHVGAALWHHFILEQYLFL